MNKFNQSNNFGNVPNSFYLVPNKFENINVETNDNYQNNRKFLGKGTYGVAIKSGNNQYVKKIQSIDNLVEVKKVYSLKMFLQSKIGKEKLNKYFILPVSYKIIDKISLGQYIKGTNKNAIQKFIIDNLPGNKLIIEKMMYFPNSIDFNKLNIPLRNFNVKIVCLRLLESIKLLHNNDIIHNDLKPQNIIIAQDFLFSNKNSVKNNYYPHLIDFGLSTNLNNTNFSSFFFGSYTLFKDFYFPKRSTQQISFGLTKYNNPFGFIKHFINNDFGVNIIFSDETINSFKKISDYWKNLLTNFTTINEPMKKVMKYMDLIILAFIIYGFCLKQAQLNNQEVSDDIETWFNNVLIINGELPDAIPNINEMLSNFKKISIYK